MAQLPCIGLYQPCINLPFWGCAMYFDYKVQRLLTMVSSSSPGPRNQMAELHVIHGPYHWGDPIALLSGMILQVVVDWLIFLAKYTLPKTNMTRRHPPFQDVFPIENRDLPMTC